MRSFLSRWFPFLRSKRRSKGSEVWPLSSTPESSPSSQSTNASTSSALRQNLRLKCGFDEGKIDRLIEHERSQNPNASADTLMEAAIERWERENR